MQLAGLHHLTAISAAIRDNVRFYTQTLGMRLVKRSVNQDDVSAYHLFYADGIGSPGTDLTFFDWPAAPERRGTRSIVRTGLRVHGSGTLAWWAARFAELGVTHGSTSERDGRVTLDFEDPEGQRLALVDDGGLGDPPVVWERSPVPPEHQIRGLGPITISVPALAPTAALLTEALHMAEVRDYAAAVDSATGTLASGSAAPRVHVFAMGEGGAHAELHVAVEPHLRDARQGAGAVHHVAFRIPDADYDAWADYLTARGIPNSGKVDRFWFRSLYLREPNGVLFEIATEGPGFAVDEDAATLGEAVVLPPFLEPRREQIVRGLTPLD